MAQDRVVFVPWNTDKAGKFATDAGRSNDRKARTHHKRSWTTYFLDSAGTPLTEVGFGFSARLHIFGHGSATDSTQTWPDVQDGTAPVTPADLATLLVNKGLPKRYMGTVVCDICYSAIGAPSFAKRLARELYKKGYICPVMGFKGAIFAMYTTNTPEGHKYLHRMIELDDGSLIKSKNASERFWGHT